MLAFRRLKRHSIEIFEHARADLRQRAPLGRRRRRNGARRSGLLGHVPEGLSALIAQELFLVVVLLMENTL